MPRFKDSIAAGGFIEAVVRVAEEWARQTGWTA